MGKIDDIKAAVSTLTPAEQAALRAWLEELAAQRFDEQIEADIKAGKLDFLVEEVEREHAAGLTHRIK